MAEARTGSAETAPRALRKLAGRMIRGLDRPIQKGDSE
jgi:hypothetical protein